MNEVFILTRKETLSFLADFDRSNNYTLPKSGHILYICPPVFSPYNTVTITNLGGRKFRVEAKMSDSPLGYMQNRGAA